MKYLLLAGLLIGLPLSGRSQDSRPLPWKSPHKTKDPQVLEVTQNGYNINLVYIDQAEQAAKFEKDAELNRWTPDEKAAEKAKLPAGGYLEANWARSPISSASAENFTFLIEAPDGSAILRWKPEPSVPHLFAFMGATTYTSLEVVPLAAPLPDGAKVYIIEAAAQKRYQFVIHPSLTK